MKKIMILLIILNLDLLLLMKIIKTIMMMMKKKSIILIPFSLIPRNLFPKLLNHLAVKKKNLIILLTILNHTSVLL